MVAPCNPEPAHRKLIYLPIVHNMADMGALRESVKEASVRKIGRQSWKRKQNLIEKLWDDTESVLGELCDRMDKIRVYQDGLPISGNEENIVRDLAASGSRNHQLVLRLVKDGATLMGTESPDLLLEEYEIAKRRLSAVPRADARRRESFESTSLLQRRDKFIAERINDTLKEGEVGIIFLGMLHAPEPWLAEDIRVSYPIGRPRRPDSPEIKGGVATVR